MENQEIIGCILAGGQSTRMQGPEKTLMELDGMPMILRIAERLQARLPVSIINANGDPERFSAIGLPVQSDLVEGFAGPLAGVHAGMHWVANHAPDASHLLTVAGDTPFFPPDLPDRLIDATSGSEDGFKPAIAMAFSDGNRHPTFGLWPVCLKDELEAFLNAGDRKVMLFAQRHNLVKVDFPMLQIGGDTLDPFFNVNTPEDFARAETILAGMS